MRRGGIIDINRGKKINIRWYFLWILVGVKLGGAKWGEIIGNIWGGRIERQYFGGGGV
jgi:hypothetical protein